MRVSFVVHTYNEGPALLRLVRSSIPLADLVAEWVVVDHRSDDDTRSVCAELADEMAVHGVPLRYLYEARDFSASFTFADLRQSAVKAANSEIVALHDADFILGVGYRAILQAGIAKLTAPGSNIYGCGYTIPVIWDHLTTDAAGVIVDHGRVWLHGRPPRILHRDSICYQQTGNGGMWEQATSTNRKRRKRGHLSKPRPSIVRESLVSVNAKPSARRSLRHTMGTFQRDLQAGRVTGEWLENYRKGSLKERNPYDFGDFNLRGWRLHVPALEVTA